MLTEFGVQNKVINSQVKDLPTTRLYVFGCDGRDFEQPSSQRGKALDQIDFVIIDEAHYNSFF